MSCNDWMDKHTVVYTYHRILVDSKKNQIMPPNHTNDFQNDHGEQRSDLVQHS